MFAEADLGNGDFDVLATLRRAGPPFRLTAGELSASTLVTSGPSASGSTGSSREGLVTREVSASDGRGREIQLTPEGRRLTDELVVRHWANEDRLLSALDPGEREQLVGLLRKLLLDVEGPAAGPVDAT